MRISFFPLSDIPKSDSQLSNRFPETFLNEGFSWGVAGFSKGSPSCDIALVVSDSGQHDYLAFACLMLTIETLEQGVKYVQS